MPLDPKLAELLQPALPAPYAVDTLGQTVAPFPGLDRLTFVALELFKCGQADSITEAIQLAKDFLHACADERAKILQQNKPIPIIAKA